MCWLTQWRIAYLFSVAMSLDDDSCESLITAVSHVFDDCGVQHFQPPNEHFMSVEDYKLHADEVWTDLRQKARSMMAQSLEHPDRRPLLLV